MTDVRNGSGKGASTLLGGPPLAVATGPLGAGAGPLSGGARRRATARATDLLGSGPVHAIGRRATRRRLRVLAYHDVVHAEAFTAQVAHLVRHWQPVSGAQVAAAVHGGPALPALAVWLTFDDGRPGVVEHGLPVLDAAGVPATLFVCPGVIEGRSPYWWQVVESRPQAEVELGGRSLAGRALVSALKQEPDVRRRAVVAALSAQPATIAEPSQLDRSWAPHGRAIAFATATPAARRSHLRNGATALDPIRHRLAFLPPGRAAVETGEAALDGFTQQGGLRTAWDTDALRWRFDPLSRHDSQISALRTADHATGAVTRQIQRRGVPLLVVELSWGPPAAQRALLGSLLRREHAVGLLAAGGPGAAPSPGLALRSAGASLLCVWDRSPSAAPLGGLRREDWSASLADLGGAI